MLSNSDVLSEVDAIATEVFRAIKQADPENQCEIVGSYRQGEPWSSDVDLVVRHPAFEGVSGITQGFSKQLWHQQLYMPSER